MDRVAWVYDIYNGFWVHSTFINLGEETEMSYEKPVVKLVGEDGNAFSILARVRAALRKAEAGEEVISKYIEEATSDDYEHLLRITMKYVEVE